MSQILYYRQHWMATLKERHVCKVCGELAKNATWTEVDGIICNVNWYCRVDRTSASKLPCLKLD